ncbi:unnamed protein product [Linum trigynum]|uniref:BHLH domain-containing protein n=1 Tax=Linum trigynum TaxID=586398 RepID=A0AAV2G4C3_9ROSI
MFPLYQGNELCFQISSSSSPNPQHLILPTNTTPPTPIPNPHHTYHAPAPAPRRRKKPASNPAVMENSISGGAAKDGGGQEHEKKVMHREIERQRRQEMSTLYASLRFLLPLKFIKGRRSMSDHMNEAVNYIKHLQRRIQDLDAQKNQLVILRRKKKKNTTTLTNNIGSSSTTTASVTARPSGGHPTVEVRRCLGGLEIVLAEEEGGGGGCGLRLSRVMRLLVEEGVSVVNCVSTVVNRKSFHTLLVEVDQEQTSFDTRALQQKLMRINLILDH